MKSVTIWTYTLPLIKYQLIWLDLPVLQVTPFPYVIILRGWCLISLDAAPETPRVTRGYVRDAGTALVSLAKKSGSYQNCMIALMHHVRVA